jgi:hypothetical protein
MGTSRSDTVHEADEQWARTASELVAYREQYRNTWGDVDDLVLARFLSGEITDDEAERVRRALADHPAVRECIAIVEEVFDQARELPDPAAAPPVNPARMSTSLSSGVHQEDGLRFRLGDDLIAPQPATGAPLHIAVIGSLLGALALILLVMSLIRSVVGADGSQNHGWLCLAAVSGFGIYACVEFIRGKSVKLLMLALALVAAVDVIGLIAYPLVQPMLQDQGQIVKEVKPQDLDESDKQIRPFEERMNIQGIELGVGFLLICAVLSLYLRSPPVQKYFSVARGERDVY